MTVKELAEALEKKENNVRVMLFRALSALRETLGEPKEQSNEQQKFNQNFKESKLT
jgi:DNA-directed RNA polymerase specialized sigma24 family protein